MSLAVIAVWSVQGKWDALLYILAATAMIAAMLDFKPILLLPPLFIVLIGKAVDQRMADGWFDYKRPYWIAWQEVQHWAASHTSSDAIFLVPLDMRLIGFQNISHRGVWVDLRQGAAVMWEPSFYKQWAARISEQNSLGSVEARLSYACHHSISYDVEWNTEVSSLAKVYRNDLFSVLRVPSPCPLN